MTGVQVFAIVGDFTNYNPADYLRQQKVPIVGAGLDASFCSTFASTSLWSFGPAGCQTNPKPSKVADTGRLPYQYTVQKTGNKHPTIAVFSSQSNSGKQAATFAVPALAGAGFKVVYADGLTPADGVVSDYTPYVQKLLKANNGKAPDAIDCLLTVECISIWNLLRANGYQRRLRALPLRRHAGEAHVGHDPPGLRGPLHREHAGAPADGDRLKAVDPSKSLAPSRITATRKPTCSSAP